MDTLSDISRQQLDIQDTHDVVSVELVQHQKIRLQLETDDARETIKAELFTKGCKDDLPCPRLAHSVLHADSQTYITLSVHSDEQDQRWIFVMVVLVSILSCVLLAWMIRKWIKWKYRQQECTEDTRTKEDLSSAKEIVSCTLHHRMFVFSVKSYHKL